VPKPHKASTHAKASFQAVPASFSEDITNFLLYRKRNGIAHYTIINEVRTLKKLAREVNLNNPEEVKTAIANAKVSNTTKSKRAKQYSAYLKFKGVQWQQPKYKEETHIPFIPTEQELDLLLTSCRPKLATVLQMLKETGMRIGEAHLLKWIDIDLERKVVSITPEKGSNPRLIPISAKLTAMLNKYPKTNEHVLPKSKGSFRSTFDKQRKRTATKIQNPRLMKISFHTFRHWKGTIEYHKTKDIIHVQTILGHKDIKTTLKYINIEQALFLSETDEWITKVSHNLKEETELVTAGFTLVRSINETTALYKKRK